MFTQTAPEMLVTPHSKNLENNIAQVILPTNFRAVTLRAGQTLWEPLPKGAQILVQQGRLCLYWRAYVGETLMFVPIPLTQGVSYEVNATDWCQITAQSAAQLLIREPVSKTWLQRFFAALAFT